MLLPQASTAPRLQVSALLQKGSRTGSSALCDGVKIASGRVSSEQPCQLFPGIRQEVLCRAAEVVEVLKCGKPVQRLENSRMTFKDTVYKVKFHRGSAMAVNVQVYVRTSSGNGDSLFQELARKLAEFDAEAEDVNRFLSSVFSAAASLHQSKLGVGEAAI